MPCPGCPASSRSIGDRFARHPSPLPAPHLPYPNLPGPSLPGPSLPQPHPPARSSTKSRATGRASAVERSHQSQTISARVHAVLHGGCPANHQFVELFRIRQSGSSSIPPVVPAWRSTSHHLPPRWSGTSLRVRPGRADSSGMPVGLMPLLHSVARTPTQPSVLPKPVAELRS